MSEASFLDAQIFFLAGPDLCGWVQCYAKEEKPRDVGVPWWCFTLENGCGKLNTQYSAFDFFSIPFVWHQEKKVFSEFYTVMVNIKRREVCLEQQSRNVWITHNGDEELFLKTSLLFFGFYFEKF